MEDFNFNNTSWNKSVNDTNRMVKNYEEYNNGEFILHVATCIIITIGLPLILVAIYSLYSLVRKDNVAPIYVINLLMSDLIQLCCMIVKEVHYRMETPEDARIHYIFSFIHLYCLVVSVGFMVCISLERYLVIACPLWYRFRRTIKISVVVCVFVWALPLVPLLAIYLSLEVGFSVFILFLLLSFPLFIFFLGGTLKALSASKSVPTDEKRRIVGILVLVLLIYTLLFLPYIIDYMYAMRGTHDFSLSILGMTFIRLSPLADLVLYIFMRKGAIDKLLASLCCCRMDSNDGSSSSVAMSTCVQSA